jgi:hypothetical protein
VLVGENPLTTIRFREGAEEPMGAPIEEGGAPGADGGKGSTHRPYSFQQRAKKKV